MILRAITDDRLPDDMIAEKVERICRAGRDAVCVHLRDKNRTSDALFPLATRLRAITRDHGSTLVLGDAYALAERIEFDGLHGWNAPKPDSVAAHEDGDIERALRIGAKGALVSPIFETPEKGPPRGVEALRRAREIAPELFLWALGGVHASNARACIEAGANGIAVVRALFVAPNIEDAVRALLEAAGAR